MLSHGDFPRSHGDLLRFACMLTWALCVCCSVPFWLAGFWLWAGVSACRFGCRFVSFVGLGIGVVVACALLGAGRGFACQLCCWVGMVAWLPLVWPVAPLGPVELGGVGFFGARRVVTRPDLRVDPRWCCRLGSSPPCSFGLGWPGWGCLLLRMDPAWQLSFLWPSLRGRPAPHGFWVLCLLGWVWFCLLVLFCLAWPAACPFSLAPWLFPPVLEL